MKFPSLDPDVKVLLPDGSTRSLMTYLAPTALFMLAALLLMTSIFTPYWTMRMSAPQYPKGLRVNVYLSHIEGDVFEIDELNHYLGMPKLDEGGRLERSLSIVAMVVLGFLLVGSIFVHNQWAALFTLPALGFPFMFLADLWWILYQYGHSIDPKSALGGAIKPFTPPLFGEGKIGQFGTSATPEVGLFLAFAAMCVILVGLWYHRAAYKPIVDARKRMREGQRIAPETQVARAGARPKGFQNP
jgi:hypothetical protein